MIRDISERAHGFSGADLEGFLGRLLLRNPRIAVLVSFSRMYIT